MRGPRAASCIFPERFLQEARQTVRQRTALWQDVQRFRLVLLLHENPGIGNEFAGKQVGLSARQRNEALDVDALVGRRLYGKRPGRAKVERPLFPPMDRAIVVAIACETVAQTQEPLSRQSLDDLTPASPEGLGQAHQSLDRLAAFLHEDAIKPWQYEHWIFPRDPQFRRKAGPIVDLYAGIWEEKPLGPKDYVLSGDEKDQHPSAPNASIRRRRQSRGRRRRVEPEYKRSTAAPAVSGLLGRASWSRHGTLRRGPRRESFQFRTSRGPGLGKPSLRSSGPSVFHR